MALVSVEGQITTIQHPSRTLVIKDREGISHPVRWPQGLDERAAKLKQWFFTKATGEESEGVIMLQDLGYFKPEDWPKEENHGGNKGGYSRGEYDPKRQAYIIRQSSIGYAIETLKNGANSETIPEDVFIDKVLQIAGKYEEWVMR